MKGGNLQGELNKLESKLLFFDSICKTKPQDLLSMSQGLTKFVICLRFLFFVLYIPSFHSAVQSMSIYVTTNDPYIRKLLNIIKISYCT